MQLRRLDFSHSIGCLARSQDGSGCLVRKRVMTIDLNMQELEGLAPSGIQDIYYGTGADSRDGTLSSANDYVAMLLQIADNAFCNGPGTATQEDGEDFLYHMHMFRKYAEDCWLDRTADSGPFVLVHGDLEPYNLLLDRDMTVVAVLDWEWSRVVPRQFFTPPLWLSNTSIEDMSYGYEYNDYLGQFDEFLAILRAREAQRYGNELLADEWDQAKRKSGFMVAHVLETWTAMDWFASRYINFRQYGGKADLEDRVAAFIKDDPVRENLVRKKVSDWASYTAQLKQLSSDSHACEVLPDRNVQPAAARGLVNWFQKMPLLSLARTLSIAAGAFVIISAGTSYLFGRRTFQPRR